MDGTSWFEALFFLVVLAFGGMMVAGLVHDFTSEKFSLNKADWTCTKEHRIKIAVCDQWTANSVLEAKQ